MQTQLLFKQTKTMSRSYEQSVTQSENSAEKVLSIFLKLYTTLAEARKSMSNCDIYFPLVPKITQTTLKIFSQYHLI